MHDAMRKHIQFSTMQRRHGRIPAHDVGGSGSKEAPHCRQHHQLQQPPGAPMAPPSDMPAEATVSAGDGSAGSSSSWVKPGCMMELARLAKIPQPESGIMCPRCQSTETKFCYYNNYSLSQPRHFCKMCRRYWTHGGALRDLPFASSVRRRRSKPANNNRHASSKLACCSSGTGRAAASSSSGGATVSSRRVVAASMTMPPLEQLPLSPAPVHQLGVGGGDHRHRTGASRLWFPGRHSSQLDDHPMGYRHHQLGNSIGGGGGGGGATTFKLEHQCYLPQRQPFSFLGYYKNAVTATTSAICPFSAEGGAEAASFAGQMQAISISRVPSSAALTMELASEMMMAENQPIPSTEIMGTLMSSPREFLVGLQGDNDLHFLGSGSWACGYGSTSAGNGGGGISCTVAPANVWADPPCFTSSSSGTIL